MTYTAIETRFWSEDTDTLTADEWEAICVAEEEEEESYWRREADRAEYRDAIAEAADY